LGVLVSWIFEGTPSDRRSVERTSLRVKRRVAHEANMAWRPRIVRHFLIRDIIHESDGN
jgi:hypothetical protein